MKDNSKKGGRKHAILLDPNHTHQVIIDDGKADSFYGMIKLWAATEKKLRETLEIPGVLICVQGGLGTLETCATYLKEGTPLVLLQGSGSAADVIATREPLCTSL